MSGGRSSSVDGVTKTIALQHMPPAHSNATHRLRNRELWRIGSISPFRPRGLGRREEQWSTRDTATFAAGFMLLGLGDYRGI